MKFSSQLLTESMFVSFEEFYLSYDRFFLRDWMQTSLCDYALLVSSYPRLNVILLYW